MKKLFAYVILLLSVCSFANADSVVVPLGGIGTKADAVTAFGAIKKSVWDAGSASDFMGTNGAALVTSSSVSLVDNGTDATVTDTGAYGSVVNGMYVKVTSASGSTPLGYYEITSHTSDTITFSDTDLTASTLAGNDTVSLSIGGAGLAATGSNIQDRFDAVGNTIDSTLHVAHVLLNTSETLITAPIDIDTMTGSTQLMLFLTGSNSSFVDDGTKATLRGDTGFTGLGLFVVGANTVNIVVKNFILDADDKAASALRTMDPSQSTWIDCEFKNATSHGIVNDGGGSFSMYLVEPIIRDNGGRGVAKGSNNDSIVKCYGGSVFGNTSDGIEVSGAGCILNGISIYLNGGNGILFDQYPYNSIVHNCTVDNNTASGLAYDGLGSAATRITVSNTAFSNNAADFSATGADYYEWRVFNCCVYGNTTTYTPVDGRMTQWSIITDNPSFTDAANGDFTPSAGSALIGAGITGTTIGSMEPAAGAGGSTEGFPATSNLGGILQY
jgi:hypothetical protein